MKKVLLIVVVGLSIPFLLATYFISLERIFAPRSRSVQRKVFENTKSYVHGRVQDLAKYYDEYRRSSPEDRRTLEEVIKIRFADFDANKIAVPELKRFLVQVRGY